MNFAFAQTYDDNATVELGSVSRYVPVLTLETRRFDAMEQRMSRKMGEWRERGHGDVEWQRGEK